uniref:Coiled-coil domain containing 134 n=2 Tax=Lepisosteidae TaxID=7915 RepID=W5N1S7_LEPOC
PLMDVLCLCAVLLGLVGTALSSSSSESQRQRHDSNLEICILSSGLCLSAQLESICEMCEVSEMRDVRGGVLYPHAHVDTSPLFLQVLEDSRAVLMAANMQPDDPFPLDDKLKEAYSHVVENTAFFGDVALRFPRIVHHYFDRNANWNLLLRWGLSFCNQTGVFTGGAHQHVLTLMAQELGIIEKSPDFTNPYRTERDDVLHTAEAFQRVLREEEKRRRKEEKRKEIRKGPRISRSRSEL